MHIRRLSVLRENFKACNLKSLKYDIPLMALTATATIHVREDILKSLRMSKETKIVLTSFFRPNLRFSVSCFLLFLPLCQYETWFFFAIQKKKRKKLDLSCKFLHKHCILVLLLKFAVVLHSLRVFCCKL